MIAIFATIVFCVCYKKHIENIELKALNKTLTAQVLSAKKITLTEAVKVCKAHGHNIYDMPEEIQTEWIEIKSIKDLPINESISIFWVIRKGLDHVPMWKHQPYFQEIHTLEWIENYKYFKRIGYPKPPIPCDCDNDFCKTYGCPSKKQYLDYNKFTLENQ